MPADAPAARFARWRVLTRSCFLLGVVLCLLARDPWPTFDGARQVVVALGLALLGLTFVLYFRYCNRCPRCAESFSRAPDYTSAETNGLALFGRIERCPFCAEPLA